VSRFPAAFPLPAFASWSSCPAGELSSPHGRPTEPTGSGPRRGFRVSHARATTGVGAPSTPRTTVLTLTGVAHRPASAASQRRVLAPRHNLHSCGTLHHEASTRGSHKFARPIFPSPVAPGWNGRPWASPRASHPAITRSARRGGDRPSSTSLKHALRHRPSLQSCVFTQMRATSRRTRQCRSVGSDLRECRDRSAATERSVSFRTFAFP